MRRLEPQDVLARLQLKSETGCAEWVGARNRRGYGHLHYHGVRWYAHRLVYTLQVAPIPTGLSVLHSCDNPGCCNVEHLFLGTQADNMADMVFKNRAQRVSRLGAEHPSTKISDDQVLSIRQMRAEYGLSHSELADLFSISRSHVGNLLRGSRRAA